MIMAAVWTWMQPLQHVMKVVVELLSLHDVDVDDDSHPHLSNFVLQNDEQAVAGLLMVWCHSLLAYDYSPTVFVVVHHDEYCH